MPRLEVELVPSTCWWSNVRSNVSRADWEKCKRLVRHRSGDRCEICGGQGRKWPVECHEIWDYNDDEHIQTLVGLIALCPACHECKHIGRAMRLGNGARALAHLANVNQWSLENTQQYLEVVLELWSIRSTYEWKLDISILDHLGIAPLREREPSRQN